MHAFVWYQSMDTGITGILRDEHSVPVGWVLNSQFLLVIAPSRPACVHRFFLIQLRFVLFDKVVLHWPMCWRDERLVVVVEAGM